MNDRQHQGRETKFLALCEHCPLPDCIRPEGMLTPVPQGKVLRPLPSCLVWFVANEGLDPGEVDRVTVGPEGFGIR